MRWPLRRRRSGAPSAPLAEYVCSAQIEHDAAHQRDHAHQQRQGEAVPHRQAVGRACRRPAPTRRRYARNGPMVSAGKHADHEAGQHQKLDRKTHPERRLVRLARQIRRRRAEEHAVDEAQRIGDAEHAGQGRDVGQRIGRGSNRRGSRQRLGEEHLLGQESVEQRHARHRRGRHHRERRRDRHEAVQAAQPPDVARARSRGR